MNERKTKMQMNERTYTLFLAQQIAEKHGDVNWWREHYVMLRENNNIVDSAKEALRAQGLLDKFHDVVKKLQSRQTA